MYHLSNLLTYFLFLYSSALLFIIVLVLTGAVIRFIRECSMLDQESGCSEATPEKIKQGLPAKSCIFKCNSDGCNPASALRCGLSVLLASVLLTLMLQTIKHVWPLIMPTNFCTVLVDFNQLFHVATEWRFGAFVIQLCPYCRWVF